MDNKKTVRFGFASQIVKPRWRNLTVGDGVAEIESAEFRVRNAVAGNGHSVNLVFETIARQSQQGKHIFGPFIFAGASGTGKSAFVQALVSSCDSRFLVEFDLGTCHAEHESASIFGAPPGYNKCDTVTPFAQSLVAMNDALAAYSSPAEEMLLPVLCFDNADDAHPQVLAALKRLITSGIISSHSGAEVKLNRCVIVLTVNRVGDALNSLRSRNPRSIGPELKRIIGDLKSGTGGMPVFKREIVDASTIVPFFEPAPTAITAFLAARFGRDVALACGIVEKQTGRARLAPREMARLWDSAKIESTASARHVISALLEEWNLRRFAIITLAQKVKNIFAKTPPERYAYFLEINSETGRLEWPLVSFENVDFRIIANLPIPYVERIYGESSVVRSDYWKLGGDFETRLSGVIFGQDSLIKAIDEKLRARLLENSTKPLLSFIVIGPTGTGKTELGKAIAEISGHPLVFCDCNTWQTEDAVREGIFGDSATSVATKLRENPASVIVFDEVDKAHRKFWDYYMSVGDTGYIVDKKTGLSLSLRHAMIELTSNYMADRLDGLATQAEEKTVDEMDPLIRKALGLCAAINPACLERLDLAGLMMPLAGPNTYPMWNKFVGEKLRSMSKNVTRIDDCIALYLENRHMDKGGAPGARARLRTCEALIGNWAQGCDADFDLINGKFCLSRSGANSYKSAPTPRSERQRFWTVTEEVIARFKAEYRGNDALVDSVVALVKEEGMKVKPRGPVGVILAVGPTGTGKSYLGKALSRAFGKGEAVEIPCVQCGDAHSVASFLFSSPAGYTGSQCGGQLTTPVMTRKDRVFILDEIDRAHPSLLDKVLNVLDEGMATEMGTQVPVDLRQSLFVLTSNLAGEELDAMMRKMSGATLDEQEAAARKLIENTGRISAPMLARIHRVFALTYLEPENGFGDVRSAIRNVLGEYDRHTLHVDEGAVRFLARECHAQSRRDVRTIQRIVQAKLAPALLGEPNSELVLSSGVIRTRFAAKFSCPESRGARDQSLFR